MHSDNVSCLTCVASSISDTKLACLRCLGNKMKEDVGSQFILEIRLGVGVEGGRGEAESELVWTASVLTCF